MQYICSCRYTAYFFMNKNSPLPKKIALNADDEYVSATLYADNPEVLYVKAKFRFCPPYHKPDYKNETEKIKEEFAAAVKLLITHCSEVDNRYLCSIDLSGGSMKVNKNSRARYEFYVKPTSEGDITEAIERLADSIADSVKHAVTSVGFVLQPKKEYC